LHIRDKLIIQVEQELLKHIPVWEEINGRPFMVQGERVVDKIHDALEAKDQAKEAKKVSLPLPTIYGYN
jgi:protein regulator of cytokinesis 1